MLTADVLFGRRGLRDGLDSALDPRRGSREPLRALERRASATTCVRRKQPMV